MSIQKRFIKPPSKSFKAKNQASKDSSEMPQGYFSF